MCVCVCVDGWTKVGLLFEIHKKCVERGQKNPLSALSDGSKERAFDIDGSVVCICKRGLCIANMDRSFGKADAT